jgi:hypothetical protein
LAPYPTDEEVEERAARDGTDKIAAHASLMQDGVKALEAAEKQEDEPVETERVWDGPVGPWDEDAYNMSGRRHG